MKHKKLFALLALVMTAMTASADHEPAFKITMDAGIDDHGTVTYKVNDTETTPEEGVIKVDENDVITVAITPDEGWTATPSGQWSAAIAAARNRASEVDMLKDITLTEAGENTWTFTMERANAVISATYKKLMTHTDITIEDIAAMSYTGKALKPAVVVKDGEKTLVEGTDYTVSYSNNVNAGTATATITGIGDYSGTVPASFTINPTSGRLTFAASAIEKTYGDAAFTNQLTVEGDGSVSYSSVNPKIATVDAETGEVTVLRAGTILITATLSDGANYSGTSASYTLTVSAELMSEVTGTRITLDADGYHFVVNENESAGAVIGSEYSEAVTMNYTRTLKTDGKTPMSIAGEQGFLFTICTPFKPCFDAKFYTLESVNGSSLMFMEVEDPVEYTPYLVSVTEDVPVKSNVGTSDFEDPDWQINRAAPSDYTVRMSNVDFNHSISHSAVINGYQLKGTLRGLSNADASAEGSYILQDNGTWGAVKSGNAGAYIPPFRAYIVGASQGARSLGTGIDGGATGIDRIVTVDLDGTERWYDLQGRRIEKPATKGIYIHNGRKETVK